MKIRVIGTEEECDLAQCFFNALGLNGDVVSCTVSELYPNRGSVNQYRVYVEVVCKDETNIFGDLLPTIAG